jgi:sialidase-1
MLIQMKVDKFHCYSVLFFSLLIVAGLGCKVRVPSTESSTVVTVFEPNSTYASMRIPALVVSKKGTLLAFCEGRISTASDWADMDILLKRSTDGGKTWLKEQVVAPRMDHQPTSNATPIVDRDGTIHLLYQRNYAKAFYTRSTDDGRTWSQAVDITYVFEKFRPIFNWQVLAPGPGHSIQLANGRLVVPVWMADPDKLLPHKSHRPSCIATIYSDDLGKTWQNGEIIAINHPDFKNPSETVAVQLNDGRVMLNIRNETAVRRRGISFSADGAKNWTVPVFDQALYEPICMASLIALPRESREGKTALLFINPDTKEAPKVTRKNLTAKVSFDDGESWAISKVLDPGFAGYSDVAIGKKDEVFCLYESSETVSRNYKIVLRTTALRSILGQ